MPVPHSREEEAGVRRWRPFDLSHSGLSPNLTTDTNALSERDHMAQVRKGEIPPAPL